MFFDDAKKTAMTIIGRRKANGARVSEPTAMKSEVVKTEDGEVDGRHVAAQDMFAAHSEGSPQKFMDALASFIDIHSSAPPKAPEG